MLLSYFLNKDDNIHKSEATKLQNCLRIKDILPFLGLDYGANRDKLTDPNFLKLFKNNLQKRNMIMHARRCGKGLGDN